MNDVVTYGLVAVAVLAVLGLGVRFVFNFKSGDKTIIKNVDAKGDVVGRDKIEK